MAPFRNVFTKKPPLPNGIENQRPAYGAPNSQPSSLSASRTSSSIDIKSKNEEPTEYKLGLYDSGVYLPPSPPEKKSLWAKTTQSNGKSNHRSMLNENEPFSISRESFDSYRRSFDISARSPVPQQEAFSPRQSLDSGQVLKSPRRPRKKSMEPPVQGDEDAFEDVGLNDEAKQNHHNNNKKRGLFARFGENNNAQSTEVTGDAARPGSSHRGFHIPGRKRGQSGQGAELGTMDRSVPKRDTNNNNNDDGVIR